MTTTAPTTASTATATVATVEPFSTESITADHAVRAMLASKAAADKLRTVTAQLTLADVDAFELSALTTAAYLWDVDGAKIDGHSANKLRQLASSARTGYSTAASVLAHGRTGYVLSKLAGKFEVGTSARDLQATFVVQAPAGTLADAPTKRPSIAVSESQLNVIVSKSADRADALKRLESQVRANLKALKPVATDGAADGADGADGAADGAPVETVGDGVETVGDMLRRALELVQRAAQADGWSADDVALAYVVSNTATDAAESVDAEPIDAEPIDDAA